MFYSDGSNFRDKEDIRVYNIIMPRNIYVYTQADKSTHLHKFFKEKYSSQHRPHTFEEHVSDYQSQT